MGDHKSQEGCCCRSVERKGREEEERRSTRREELLCVVKNGSSNIDYVGHLSGLSIRNRYNNNRKKKKEKKKKKENKKGCLQNSEVPFPLFLLFHSFPFFFFPSHVFLKQLNELVRMPFFVWGVSPVSLDIQRDEFEGKKNKINNKK